MIHAIRHLRRTWFQMTGRDVRSHRELHCDYESFGHKSGVWCVRAGTLTCDSIVYSFGIGEDLSFEIDIIQRYGMAVQAFDPTPRSLRWLSTCTLPPQLRIHAVGLAGEDGDRVFYPPAREDHVSFSAHHRKEGNCATAEGIVCKVRRLSTLMDELHHTRIDLLKMDIEGSEYEALRDVLRSRISIRQILVEFHHCWNSSDVKRTQDILTDLRSAGFKSFYVSPTGMEYSFWRDMIVSS